MTTAATATSVQGTDDRTPLLAALASSSKPASTTPPRGKKNGDDDNNGSGGSRAAGHDEEEEEEEKKTAQRGDSFFGSIAASVLSTASSTASGVDASKHSVNHLINSSTDARKVLKTLPSGVLRGEGGVGLASGGGFGHHSSRGGGGGGAHGGSSDQELVQQLDGIQGIVFPWNPYYEAWWTLTAFGAIFTVFFGPFHIAFGSDAATSVLLTDDASTLIEFVLTSIFVVDIFVNFHLAFYKNELIVFERTEIWKEYLSKMFWVDLVGVFPFETVALMMVGDLDGADKRVLLFSLFRFLRFVRLHRMKKLSDLLQYDTRVSLLWFTLLRNFAATFSVTHVEACVMYFLARYHDFDADTWLGPHLADLSTTSPDTAFDRYITSLYWSIVTFCTVG